jgi:hypothetical protein
MMDDVQPIETQIASVTASTEAAHSRIDDLETKFASLAERGIGLAETGVLGSEAQTAGTLTQEIIDWLHHMFPGHNVPGTTTAAQAQANQAATIAKNEPNTTLGGTIHQAGTNDAPRTTPAMPG